MKSKMIFLFTLTVLIVLSWLPGRVFSADDIEVIVTRDSEMECRLTTFEGAGDFAYINPDIDHLIPELGVRFPAWYTINSVDPPLPSPSPPTIAVWVNSHAILILEEPVAAVSFHYSSQVMITLQGSDENGTIIAQARGAVSDPSGEFIVWEPLSISVGENHIFEARLNGAPGYATIDDLKVCRYFNPREIKEHVRNNLAAYVTESKRFRKAIQAIDQSLNPAFWKDANNLACEQGHRVFNKERRAVRILMTLLKGKTNLDNDDDEEDNGRTKNQISSEARTVVQESLEKLTSVDRRLAVNKSTTAEAIVVTDPEYFELVERKLIKAHENPAAGDVKKDAGKFAKAIQHYKKAWKYACKAIKIAASAPEPPTEPPGSPPDLGGGF